MTPTERYINLLRAEATQVAYELSKVTDADEVLYLCLLLTRLGEQGVKYEGEFWKGELRWL